MQDKEATFLDLRLTSIKFFLAIKLVFLPALWAFARMARLAAFPMGKLLILFNKANL